MVLIIKFPMDYLNQNNCKGIPRVTTELFTEGITEGILKRVAGLITESIKNAKKFPKILSNELLKQCQ